MPIALHNAVDDDESSEASYRRITPAEFAKLDPNTVTLLDLREPADFAAHPVEGAINAPLDPLAHVLKTVPTDRTVVVYCVQGSGGGEEVAEILADRGYDAASSMAVFRVISTILKPTTINGSRCRSFG